MASNNNGNNINNMQFNPYMQFPQYGQQSFAQFFPQPQGSVYMINNSNEISTVPVGTNGVSAAICLSEMVLFLKAMQNGSPMLLRYKLNSMDAPVNQTQNTSQQYSSLLYDDNKLLDILKNYDDRIKSLELMLNNNINNNNNKAATTSSNFSAEAKGDNNKWEI